MVSKETEQLKASINAARREIKDRVAPHVRKAMKLATAQHRRGKLSVACVHLTEAYRLFGEVMTGRAR